MIHQPSGGAQGVAMIWKSTLRMLNKKELYDIISTFWSVLRMVEKASDRDLLDDFLRSQRIPEW